MYLGLKFVMAALITNSYFMYYSFTKEKHSSIHQQSVTNIHWPESNGRVEIKTYWFGGEIQSYN